MRTPAVITPELRELVADYMVLEVYDLERTGRYGDMAAARRGRELNRLGDKLIDAGVPFGPVGRRDAFTYGFKVGVTPNELRAAYNRRLAPKRRRLEREPGFKAGTRYARASMDAYLAVAAWIDRQTYADSVEVER